MTTTYISPPKPDGRMSVDVPLHNSVVEGRRHEDLMCVVGEGKNLPQGTLKDIADEPFKDPDGNPIGLMYLAVCNTCEARFVLLYETESGSLRCIRTLEK